MFLDTALMLLGSVSLATSMEFRRIAWVRLNPKPQRVMKKEIPTYVGKCSWRRPLGEYRQNKTLEKVTPLH